MNGGGSTDVANIRLLHWHLQIEKSVRSNARDLFERTIAHCFFGSAMHEISLSAALLTAFPA
jgi:hypothetical protein